MTESRSRFIGDGVSTAAQVAAEAGATAAAEAAKAKARITPPNHCQCPHGLLAIGKHNTDCPLFALPNVKASTPTSITEADRQRRSKLEGFEALTHEQSKQLLEFFMYRLGGNRCDLREELAATLPQAYNAWCGRDIVQVVSTDDTGRQWKVKPTA